MASRDHWGGCTLLEPNTRLGLAQCTQLDKAALLLLKSSGLQREGWGVVLLVMEVIEFMSLPEMVLYIFCLLRDYGSFIPEGHLELEFCDLLENKWRS